MTPLSILELVRVTQDTDARGALKNARDIAAHAEKWGYRRIWVAEHHNMAGIASAATSVVLAHLAEGTTTIRVGAGGIMLPNHAPYVIAEQFGTLARLFPGRIDLGLGRAPGTDQLTLRALRRTPEAAENFPQDVLELQAFLAPVVPGQRIQAVPAAGTEVPLWILGSSNFGAMLAAELGLPYAFASHFAPELLIPALRIYATASSRLNSSSVPMRWSGSTSSPPRPTTKRSGSPRPSKCRSPISSAAPRGLASRRSTMSKPIGRRWRRRKRCACSPARSSALGTR